MSISVDESMPGNVLGMATQSSGFLVLEQSKTWQGFGPGRLVPFQTNLSMVQEMAQARVYSH